MKKTNQQLEARLLALGGKRCVIPVVEEDLEKILERAFPQEGRQIIMMKGAPSQCHMNSALCWDANQDRCQLMTGYALSKDGIWRPHSWCRDLSRCQSRTKAPRVVETTEKRKLYFGFVMTTDEAEKFYVENAL